MTRLNKGRIEELREEVGGRESFMRKGGGWKGNR